MRFRTWDGYRAIIDTHILPVIGTLQMHNVRPGDVERCLLSATGETRLKIYRYAFRVFEHARKRDAILKNPVELVDAPKRSAARVSPLPTADLAPLFEKIAEDRLEALWLLYIATGLRRGEALAIDRKADLRFVRRTIGRRVVEVAVVTTRGSLQRIDGALVIVPPKTKKGYRTIELPIFMTAPLKRHLARHDGSALLFTSGTGTPLEPRNILRRWHRLLASAGLAKQRLHAVRHTALSILLQAGVDIKTVQEIAGHSRASITLDTYGHLLPGTSGDGARAMDAAMRRMRKPAR